MNNYYASNYLNVYDSYRDTSILFNGFTGTIDEVSRDLGRMLSESVAKHLMIPSEHLSLLSDYELKFLEKRGHITTLDLSAEVDKFKKYVENLNNYVNERSATEGALMLVPSYNCNLACSYCYQKTLRGGDDNKNRIMTKQQVDFIFTALIGQLFPKVTSNSKISVMLYGGEPFLSSNKEVIAKMLEYTTKDQIRLSAISNATQLHSMLEFFGNDVGLVNSVQVSFDGAKEHHDSSRVDVYQNPTFEQIIENVHKLLDRRVRVGIRMNIDKHAAPTMPSLLERLKNEGILDNSLVRPYAWVIHSHFDQIETDKLLTPIGLAKYMEDHKINVETPIGRRERRLKQVFDAVKGIPLRRTSFCMKCSPNSFLYDPYDNIYSCYEEAGHLDKRIGYVTEEKKVVINDSYYEGLKRHVAAIRDCKSCSVALTCGGGCPFAAQQRCGNMFEPDCDCQKECVEKAVQKLFKKRIETGGVNIVLNDMEDLYPNA